MKAERFLPVIGYEGLYEISDRGRLWICRIGKFKKAVCCNKKKGYLYFQVSKKCKPKNFSIHRLVLSHFSGKNFKDKHVHHINHKTSDNRLNNLMWATPKENVQYSIKAGRHICGERVFGSKLKRNQIKTIRLRRAAGERVKDLAKEYGVDSGHMSRLCRGLLWK